MKDYTTILQRFRGVRPSQTTENRWYAFCPLHKGGQEKRRSLSLGIGHNGCLLIHCFTCGHYLKRDILSAVGLKMSHLFADSDDFTRQPTTSLPDKRPIVVEKYVYRDEQGTPLYESWRYDNKGFCAFRYDNGKLKVGLQDVRRVPYRLDELLRADPRLPVYIPEGERKVNALWTWNLPATCNIGGVGMGWREDYSVHLKRRHCVVLPDNDPPGIRHANSIAGSLLFHGVPSVSILLLPGLPEKGDIIDWIGAGHTKEQLLKLIATTPHYYKNSAAKSL